MKYILSLLLLASCASKPSDEMEKLGKDVLKSHESLDIEFKPGPEQK